MKNELGGQRNPGRTIPGQPLQHREVNRVSDAPSKDHSPQALDFVEIGRQAFHRGADRAPALNAEVQQALTGLPVGTAETIRIMKDFTAGWDAANMAAPVPGDATDPEGSIWSPRDPMTPPLYEGRLSQAHTKLAPGRYKATDEHDHTVIVEVTENRSTVTPYTPDNPPRLGPTTSQAVANLADALNDENVLVPIARAVYCEVAEALAVVLDTHGEPALADFLRRVHPLESPCDTDHGTGEIVCHTVRRPRRLPIRPQNLDSTVLKLCTNFMANGEKMLELLTVPHPDLRAGDVLYGTGDLVIGPPATMTDTHLWLDVVALQPVVLGEHLKPGPRTTIVDARTSVEIQRATADELPISAPAAHVGRGGAPAALDSPEEIARQMQQWFHTSPRICTRDSALLNVPADIAARALAQACWWIDDRLWADDGPHQRAAERMTTHEVIACILQHYEAEAPMDPWDDLITAEMDLAR